MIGSAGNRPVMTSEAPMELDRGALLGLLVGAVFRFSGAYLTAGGFGRKWTDVIDVSLGLSRS